MTLLADFSPPPPLSFLSWFRGDLFIRCTFIPFVSLAHAQSRSLSRTPSMAPLTKCFVILTLALFASALATPHIARNVHHRGLAHPKGAVDARVPVPAALKRKRSLGRRCAPQPANGTNPEPSTPTPSASTPTAPVNVAANPASQSSSPAPQEPTPAPPASSPTPTPTPTPEPSTSSPAAPATTPASSSGSSSSDGGSYPSYMSGTQSGQGRQFSFFAWLSLTSTTLGTYYSTGLGACGITNNDGQRIAAVSHLLFDSYP